MESTGKRNPSYFWQGDVSGGVSVCWQNKRKMKGRNEMPSYSSWFSLSEVVCVCDWGCLEGHSQGHGSRTLKDTSLLDEREWGGWCQDTLVPSPNSKADFIFWWDVKFSIAKRRSWKGVLLEIKRYHLVIGNVATLQPNPLSALSDLNIGGHVLSI